MNLSIVMTIDEQPDNNRADSHNPLTEGYIAEGCASDPTGSACYDVSVETSYGGGRRFEWEETNTMTKIPSRHRNG